jgi:hypothetical protein
MGNRTTLSLPRGGGAHGWRPTRSPATSRRLLALGPSAERPVADRTSQVPCSTVARDPSQGALACRRHDNAFESLGTPARPVQ